MFSKRTYRRRAILATFSSRELSHILAAVARKVPNAREPLARRLTADPPGLSPQGEGGDGHEPSRPEVHFQSHPDLRNVSLFRSVCSLLLCAKRRLARRRLARQRRLPRRKLAQRRGISRWQRSQRRPLRRIWRFCAFRRREQRFRAGNFFEQRPQFAIIWPYSAHEFHEQFVCCSSCRSGATRGGRYSHDFHKRVP